MNPNKKKKANCRRGRTPSFRRLVVCLAAMDTPDSAVPIAPPANEPSAPCLTCVRLLIAAHSSAAAINAEPVVVTSESPKQVNAAAQAPAPARKVSACPALAAEAGAAPRTAVPAWGLLSIENTFLYDFFITSLTCVSNFALLNHSTAALDLVLYKNQQQSALVFVLVLAFLVLFNRFTLVGGVGGVGGVPI